MMYVNPYATVAGAGGVQSNAQASGYLNSMATGQT